MRVAPVSFAIMYANDAYGHSYDVWAGHGGQQGQSLKKGSTGKKAGTAPDKRCMYPADS